MDEELPTQRVEVKFVGVPPLGQIKTYPRASQPVRLTPNPSTL
jgi:hypothetical protein